MSRVDLVVPDLGSFDEVPVIDVLVKPGDVVEVDTPLITLETDKAAMDVPSAAAGKIVEVTIKRGDKVSKGSVIARIEAEGAAAGAGAAASSGDGAGAKTTNVSAASGASASAAGGSSGAEPTAQSGNRDRDRAAKATTGAATAPRADQSNPQQRTAVRPESGGDTVRMPLPDMSAPVR
ncbi:MAG TPA: biotin/lipoyl-containing protein, partial [Steroidobacteraceae bacterium]|nr:biotin/lipoyl-containing protein [Steroidobacteraceae bacterium]